MKSILLTLLALPFLALPVLAQDAKPPHPDKPAKPKMTPEEAFKKMDSNGDSSVSLEEFKASPHWKKDPAKADGAFARKDKDSDGKLTLEEFSAKPAKPPGKGPEPKKP